MKVKIIDDAAGRFISVLSEGRPPHAGCTRAEHMYIAALRHLQGQEWPEARGIVEGVQCASYIICDLKAVSQYRYRSKIVAVGQELIASRFNDGTDHEVPIAVDHMQYQHFLKRGLQAVEILTAWIDGFCAFLPAEKGTCSREGL